MGNNCQSCKVCRTDSLNPKATQNMEVFPATQVLEDPTPENIQIKNYQEENPVPQPVNSAQQPPQPSEDTQQEILCIIRKLFNYVDPDGSKYIGELADHQACGQGIFYYPNGNVFSGCWKNNKANGSGVLLEVNGSKWVGIWQDDLLKGIGIEMNKDYIYEGEYDDSLKHGVGQCVWNDKSTYQGEWNNDKMQGFGIYHWADGSNYEGEWFENCMNGKGILTQNNNECFEGDFQQDCKHGYGILNENNSKIIEGFWNRNKIQGIAKLINRENSSVTLVHFENGVQIKKYEDSFIDEIIPSDWVHPKSLSKDQINQINNKLAQRKNEIEKLHQLLIDTEKLIDFV